MPTREQIMAFIKKMLDDMIQKKNDIWVALYRLFLDYIHNVPRITDSNRLKKGVWLDRAKIVEEALAEALNCQTNEVIKHVDILLRQFYPPILASFYFSEFYPALNRVFYFFPLFYF